MIQGSGFRVSGSGFRVPGSGFRVYETGDALGVFTGPALSPVLPGRAGDTRGTGGADPPVSRQEVACRTLFGVGGLGRGVHDEWL
jgi:hypothetical protein